MDFQTNKRVCEEVAIIPSKALKNKIAGYTTVRPHPPARSPASVTAAHPLRPVASTLLRLAARLPPPPSPRSPGLAVCDASCLRQMPDALPPPHFRPLPDHAALS